MLFLSGCLWRGSSNVNVRNRWTISSFRIPFVVMERSTLSPVMQPMLVNIIGLSVDDAPLKALFLDVCVGKPSNYRIAAFEA